MVDLWPVPVLGDNYVWILQSEGSTGVAVVDPGVAPPVAAELADRGLRVESVLLTHHHGDHVGGVDELVDRAETPVFGPGDESIAAVNRAVSHDQAIEPPSVAVGLQVLRVPGHTAGHVAYVGPGFVLSGDTLFAGGCGRVFEGTPGQMLSSLDALARLPGDTRVYCAHEYTEANLAFAAVVEPDSPELAARRDRVRRLRANGRPSVPSTIAEELATNPFLRCDVPAVIASAERHAGRMLTDRVEVFATVRAWKDGWRG